MVILRRECNEAACTFFICLEKATNALFEYDKAHCLETNNARIV